jgi:hypothetical protein
MLYEKAKRVNDFQGRSFLSPMHRRVRTRPISLSFLLSVPPSEKIVGVSSRGGQKGRGLGKVISAPPLFKKGSRLVQ